MVDFDSMKGKVGNLYKAVWSEESLEIFSGKIRKTVSENGGESDNSYSFDVGDNVEKELAYIFGIKNEEDRKQFRDKYRFAISGDGNEGKRIFISNTKTGWSREDMRPM